MDSIYQQSLLTYFASARKGRSRNGSLLLWTLLWSGDGNDKVSGVLMLFVRILTLCLARCCNTCDELKHAYEAKGWSTNVIIRNSTQCLKDSSNPFANVRPGEGCRVSGSMKVNKVAGNFHMTLGESIVRDGAHIHQFVPSEAPGFNVSHTIHTLSFGQAYASMPPNPLDNSK